MPPAPCSFILESADNPDLAVRLAALNALRVMADEKHAGMLVERLKSAQDASERRHAALALLATCGRERIKCEPVVIGAFAEADAATRALLMRMLPLTGGPESLNQVVSRLQDDDQGVRAEAVRVLADWRDPNAIPHLKMLAKDTSNLRNHVLALRAVVRLAGPREDRPADFALFGEAMKLATRKEERVLILGVLATIPSPESLSLVAAGLDQPDIAEDAALAAVLIAEQVTSGSNAHVRAVMQKVIQTVRNRELLDRASKILKTTLQPEGNADMPHQ